MMRIRIGDVFQFVKGGARVAAGILLHPYRFFAFARLFSLAKSGRDREALELVDRCRGKRFPAICNSLALVMSHDNRSEVGIRFLQGQTQLATPTHYAWESLANAYLSSGHAAKALRVLMTMTSEHPEWVGGRSQMLLASTLRSLGRNDEALKALRKAIVLGGDKAGAHYALGFTHLELGDYTEAAAEFSESVRLYADWDGQYGFMRDINRAFACYGLGCAYHGQRDFQSAAREYTKAIDLLPNYFEAHYALGLACMDLGECEKAAFEASEALRIRPSSSEATDLRERARAQTDETN